MKRSCRHVMQETASLWFLLLTGGLVNCEHGLDHAVTGHGLERPHHGDGDYRDSFPTASIDAAPEAIPYGVVQSHDGTSADDTRAEPESLAQSRQATTGQYLPTGWTFAATHAGDPIQLGAVRHARARARMPERATVHGGSGELQFDCGLPAVPRDAVLLLKELRTVRPGGPQACVGYA